MKIQKIPLAIIVGTILILINFGMVFINTQLKYMALEGKYEATQMSCGELATIKESRDCNQKFLDELGGEQSCISEISSLSSSFGIWIVKRLAVGGSDGYRSENLCVVANAVAKQSIISCGQEASYEGRICVGYAATNIEVAQLLRDCPKFTNGELRKRCFASISSLERNLTKTERSTYCSLTTGIEWTSIAQKERQVALCGKL